MATFTEAKQAKAALEARVAELSAKLNSFPKTGALGMVSDEVKFSAAYQEVSRAYSKSFSKLRDLNAAFLKVFKKEIAAERASRRAS